MCVKESEREREGVVGGQGMDTLPFASAPELVRGAARDKEQEAAFAVEAEEVVRLATSGSCRRILKAATDLVHAGNRQGHTPFCRHHLRVRRIHLELVVA